MSSTKQHVAVATNNTNLSNSARPQKDYSAEDSLGRQNSFGNSRRGNMKGKHLTRSHAMRESASPPRTPTPRSAETYQVSPNGATLSYPTHQHHQNHLDANESNNNKLHTQTSATRGNSPTIETPTVIVTSQQKQQPNVSLCNETEFPKLTPPKSKSGGGGGGGGGSTNNNGQQQYRNISDNNSNNNNSNKKSPVDVKAVAHAETTYCDSHKGSNGDGNNRGATNVIIKPSVSQTQFSTSNASHVGEQNASATQADTIYNSHLNYQLHINDAQQAQQQHEPQCNTYDKEIRNPRIDSQNSNNSNDEPSYYDHQQLQQPQQQSHPQRSAGSKKHRTNSSSKGSKSRLKNMNTNGNNTGSGGVVPGSSMDGSVNSSNNTSGFISRENSNEQYTDHGGTDLLSFFKETLNKNVKDRQLLLKIEKDLIDFVQDGNCGEMRFPSASSYNRMLIHRTAAFFGMEHNVDTETQQCVIVAPTKNTRIPDIRFRSLVLNQRDETRKSILKRDTHSFDDARQSSYLCPDRAMLDRKAKSFEERGDEYDRSRPRIFNRMPSDANSSAEDDNYISWTSSVEPQPMPRVRHNGKMSKTQNSLDVRESRSCSTTIKANNFGNYGSTQSTTVHLLRGEPINSTKNNNTRGFPKQDTTANTNTPWRLSPSSNSSAYHFDPSNLTPPHGSNTGNGIYHDNQNNTPQHQSLKKTKGNQTQQSQKAESSSSCSAGENVSESSTQTSSTGIVEDGLNMNLDGNHQEITDVSKQCSGDECDKAANSCVSITTTISTKNYDRIEVQKFKNQSTSPNIPLCDREDVSKTEFSSQTSHPGQSRETPHSTCSTPYSNNDTFPKRSSEEPKSATWTQSYQALDGSTVFHTTTMSNGSTPYCTATYQQAPDGSIYAIPQGMIYAYPQQVEGELQGYLMPVYDTSQRIAEPANLMQAGTQTLYSTGGTTTVVPLAAYPTTQFATANGTHIYPGQVIYPTEQFPVAGATLATTAPNSATGQLHQMPMASYPIGYPYPYNGYWGQTMTYYVPQHAIANVVPATSLLPAVQVPPPPSVPITNTHVPGAVSLGLNGNHATAGPSTNSANICNAVNSTSSNNTSLCVNQTPGSSGSQAHIGSSGTTIFGTGRIKRPTPSHYTSGQSGNISVVAAASIPNGAGTAAFQLNHQVPTLTLTAAAPGTSATSSSDPSGNGATPSTGMYALSPHATIFPANVFSYANVTTAGSHTAVSNVAPSATLIPQSATAQPMSTGTISANANATVHSHQQNAMITPFYPAHPTAHPGLHTSGHAIHPPGQAAIPIVDPNLLTNISQGPSSATFARNGGNGSNPSQSTSSTPHSIPSAPPNQHNPVVFSTPPIIGSNSGNNSNGGNYNSSSTPQYLTNFDQHNQATGVGNTSNTHCSYSSTFDKRSNNISVSGKKLLVFNNNSLNRQNSANSSGYNGSGKTPLLTNSIDIGSPLSNNTSVRSHALKRGDGNEKQQTFLLSGPCGYAGNSGSNCQTSSTSDIAPINTVGISKPPIRLNAAATAFRQKTVSNGSSTNYRNNSTPQRNSPGTNSSSNENSNNNSPNSIQTCSNAAAPITSGCYAPSYMIGGNNVNDLHCNTAASSLYLAATRGTGHIPPHLQHVAAGGAALSTASPTSAVSQQAATSVLGGAAAAAAAADVAVVAAAATVAHHQPLLGTYNPGTPGVYFKYGHTYFAHPSVALPNNRRSPSTDLRPPMAQMASVYPAVNMMIPAQTRYPGRHTNPNYKGPRPR
ncbi:R3H domain containing protein encore isoform 1-T13 [Glossina fuscipes fuscipes]